MKDAEAGKRLKRIVGETAAQRVVSDSVVGLGTGSTTVFAIEYLGARLQRGEISNVVGIPTSFQASILARKHGIPVVAFEDVDRIDLAIDGADEVDPNKVLIKGGGGAHMQEKIVDGFAETFVVIVDESKLVEILGSSARVPVEVLPRALVPVRRELEALGGDPVLRMAVNKDGPVVTDQGNLILDTKFDGIPDPGGFEKELNNIPGVLENGLFVGLADVVLVGESRDDELSVREL